MSERLSDVDIANLFNEAMDKLERVINNRLLVDPPCTACIEEPGVLTLDLQRCSNWEVDVDSDIGTVNIVNGEPGQGFNIHFSGVCTEGNTTPKIIEGWPNSFGSGLPSSVDCGSGFTTGGQVGSGGTLQPTTGPGSTTEGGNTSGGFPGPGNCSCSSSANALTVTCCEENCEIDCSAATPQVRLTACGGQPPYTWSTTVGELAVSGELNEEATLTPPENTGSGVAGTAYKRLSWHRCIPSGGNERKEEFFGCDGSLDSCSRTVWGTPCYNSSTCNFTSDFPPCPDSEAPETNHGSCPLPDLCANEYADVVCDTRNASMITNGCAPCELSMIDGATVTATDSAGTSVVTVVEKA